MTTETTATTPKIHPFEKAGLGLAPFRFVGFSTDYGPHHLVIKGANGLPVEVTVGAPGQPMSSCDYCGQGIGDVYHVKSSDGRSFKVGCDCIRKVGADKMVANYSAVEKEAKKVKNAAAKSRDGARADAASALVFDEGEKNDRVREVLASRPHPTIDGLTLQDYVSFMFSQAGRSGQMKVVRIVEKIVAELDGSK